MPEDQPAHLTIESLAAYYGNHMAIEPTSLTIPRQQVTAIIGPSGCGKSTLLRSLNRLHETLPGARNEGHVWLEGEDIFAPEIDPIIVRRRIGMVFQQPNPLRARSISQNVAIGLELDGASRVECDEAVERSLKLTALWDEVKDRLHEPAIELSGGQQQRLCLARSLAVEPEVILMDEPASALDPIATLRIEELVKDLVSEYTIVIVTHNMQQAGRVSDNTVFMTLGDYGAGVVAEAGPTSEIFTTPLNSRTEDYITGRYG
ncbi:MAG: phosphate ABC transporter ATP-binding protein PstB [Thermomicrobiaceae bacterium]